MSWNDLSMKDKASYIDNYLGNKKSLGGNLYGNGGNKPRYKSSSNIRKKEKK